MMCNIAASDKEHDFVRLVTDFVSQLGLQLNVAKLIEVCSLNSQRYQTAYLCTNNSALVDDFYLHLFLLYLSTGWFLNISCPFCDSEKYDYVIEI